MVRGMPSKFAVLYCCDATKTTAQFPLFFFRNILCHFALFHRFPFSLDAHLEVDKEVFGRRAVDADVGQDVLLVMHADGVIKAYSMEYIKEKVGRDSSGWDAIGAL